MPENESEQKQQTRVGYCLPNGLLPYVATSTSHVLLTLLSAMYGGKTDEAAVKQDTEMLSKRLEGME